MVKYCKNIGSLIFHEFKQGRNANEANCNRKFDNTSRCWFVKFRSGKKNFEDKKRSGRPSTVNNQALRWPIPADLTQTTPKWANAFETSHTTIANQLYKLGKRNKRSHNVPHNLNEMQKNRRQSDCKNLILKVQSWWMASNSYLR